MLLGLGGACVCHISRTGSFEATQEQLTADRRCHMHVHVICWPTRERCGLEGGVGLTNTCESRNSGAMGRNESLCAINWLAVSPNLSHVSPTPWLLPSQHSTLNPSAHTGFYCVCAKTQPGMPTRAQPGAPVDRRSGDQLSDRPRPLLHTSSVSPPNLSALKPFLSSHTMCLLRTRSLMHLTIGGPVPEALLAKMSEILAVNTMRAASVSPARQSPHIHAWIEGATLAGGCVPVHTRTCMRGCMRGRRCAWASGVVQHLLHSKHACMRVVMQKHVMAQKQTHMC
eukprot:365124-Chlamydomonas_euryale.AAC.1